MRHLFAYGSLMHPEVFRAVVGGSNRSVTAWLEGFRRSRLRNRSYPGIRPDPEHGVDGRLYYDLDPADWTRLDHFEGALYRREEVWVRPSAGPAVGAGTYVLVERFTTEMTDEAWSFEHFVEEDLPRFRAEYFGFDRI